MKKFLALVVCVGLFAFVGGFIDFGTYETVEHHAVVMGGDTLDSIAGRYYDFTSNKYCWDEFNAKVRNDNKHLTANGRMLQPDDVVIVRVTKRVK